MIRRCTLLFLLPLLALLATALWYSASTTSSLAAAPESLAATPGAQIADLQEQLENGLKARVPADFAFIQRVVAKVEARQLPLQLVMETFHWVRKNKRNKTYLVPYFENALRLRAKKLGIRI